MADPSCGGRQEGNSPVIIIIITRASFVQLTAVVYAQLASLPERRGPAAAWRRNTPVTVTACLPSALQELHQYCNQAHQHNQEQHERALPAALLITLSRHKLLPCLLCHLHDLLNIFLDRIDLLVLIFHQYS
jgi:hypothetical protein